MKATTRTVIKSVAVSNIWKSKFIGEPIIHPTTTQNGICSKRTVEIGYKLLSRKKTAVKLERR